MAVKPVRPRDAATLIIIDPVDNDPGQSRVLMGRRAPKHDFLPDVFVFPGGRVDKSDREGPAGRGLDTAVARKLGGPPGRARALATAAIRETFEETGLALVDHTGGNEPPPLPAQPGPGDHVTGDWPGPGRAPAFHVLDYIGRAITPSLSPKRFDTRFFAAHAVHPQGQLNSNGELLDLDWYPLEQALKLPLVDVTEFMLELTSDLLHGGAQVGPGFCPAPPFFSWRAGGWLIK